jgi:hypothetical protein
MVMKIKIDFDATKYDSKMTLVQSLGDTVLCGKK